MILQQSLLNSTIPASSSSSLLFFPPQGMALPPPSRVAIVPVGSYSHRAALRAALGALPAAETDVLEARIGITYPESMMQTNTGCCFGSSEGPLWFLLSYAPPTSPISLSVQ